MIRGETSVTDPIFSLTPNVEVSGLRGFIAQRPCGLLG